MKNLVSQYNCRKVLDAACGTGLHSIALSILGVEAKGIDLSAKMIQQAQNNAQLMRGNAEFQVLPLQNSSILGKNIFDTILFLGNSLPHIIDKNELIQVLYAFAQILKPDGVLIIQLLNYKKILNNKERIISIKKHNDRIFVRFYDYLEENLRFNLLSIDQKSDLVNHQLHSTLLKPYIANELKETLQSFGFKCIKFYGSLNFEEFDPLQSSNLVIEAKPN
jgi:SAM-dependent methyltransferase